MVNVAGRRDRNLSAAMVVIIASQWRDQCGQTWADGGKPEETDGGQHSDADDGPVQARPAQYIDSRKDRKAASAGDILVARLYKRGAASIVTDGGFRDTPTIATLPFPAYHAGPSAPVSLIHHHMVEANVAIGCGDVPVYPGDVVVGDGEGVVVIPAHLANDVAEEAYAQTAYEDFVQEEVMKGRSIVGLYPATTESRREFEAWQAKTGRTDG